MIQLSEALQLVDAHVRPRTGIEPVPLARCHGRVLARAIRSDVDSPPFDRSAVDGFAISAADVGRAGRRVEVAQVVAAGASSGRRVGAGKAARIYTGAPVPPGSAAVIMQERTRPGGTSDEIVLLDEVQPGANIALRGQELEKGEVVLQPGWRIGPQEIAVLAAVGKVEVPVRPLIEVAILATGDELVDPSVKPGPGRIRNSNTAAVAALLESLPVKVKHLGIGRDQRSDLRRRVRRGLAADVLVLIGGVSVGDRDLVPEVLESEKVKTVFHRIRLKPAKPTLFGQRDRTCVFGLPGNPVSAFVAAELFVRRAIRHLLGLPVPPEFYLGALTEHELVPAGPRTEFRPARARIDAGRILVSPVKFRGSSDFPAMTHANCFIVRPAGASGLRAGGRVSIHLLEGRELGP